MRSLATISIAALLVLASSLLQAAEVEYLRDIKPLFVEKCSSCHGALQQEAGLRLDAAQLILAGSEYGPVVTPGDVDASALLDRVAADDPAFRMPPEGESEPLSGKQIALLRTWIDAGAPTPGEEPVPAGPLDHWSYRPPERPDVPHGGHDGDVCNPIDGFIAAAQQEAGVDPFPATDRTTLLRRVTFDLIGLPPTRDELKAFVKDKAAGAYERVVDRLLQSPQHGERWARHWMDIWRYSDWYGYRNQLRGSQRHIWRWRDWIVASLNADKGYHQMIREMLAADELAPGDPKALRATGFLARNYYHNNRNIWLDATVEHTAKAFLGMTINCARCHDHKYDPISQRDYYAFRAIFEPHDVRVERIPGEPDLKEDGLVRAFDDNPKAETYLYVGGNEKRPDRDHPLSPNIPQAFGELPDVKAVPLPVTSWFPNLRGFVRQDELAAAGERLADERQALDELVAQRSIKGSPANHVQSSLPPAPPMASPVPLNERLAQARVRAAEARVTSLRARWAADEARYLKENSSSFQALAVEAARLERLATLRQAEADVLSKQLKYAKRKEQGDGKGEQPQEELEAAQQALTQARQALATDDAEYTSVGEVYPQSSTGRRSALARWITDRDNPMTARVAVNHIWMRHFGEPLVKTVFDFGLRAPRPRHAELLDWLAVEFMESGWSMKRLHRLIVTSQAYRRASAASTALAAANRSIDPENELLWRANVRRLEAEVVRDSVLAVAGSLDTTLGGPDIDYRRGETVPRRSLYFRHAYEKQMTMLLLFDAANPTDCYRRSESILPQQALTLANSSLTLMQSRRLARQLWTESDSESDPQQEFIRTAFEQILSRRPTEQESAACREFLARQTSLLSGPSTLTDLDGKTEVAVKASDDPKMRARENLVHVLMNHNDFVTVR